MTSKVKGQCYNVMSVWRVFAHNSTKKSRINTEISKKVVSVTADSSKVTKSKFITRPLWVAVQVTT